MLYIKTRHPNKRGTWAKRLASRLRGRGVRAKVIGSECPRKNRKVYNMGCAAAIDDPCVDLLNGQAAVRMSVDKRQFLGACYAAGIPCPLSTENNTLATPTTKRPWYVRTLTRGRSGAGIVLVTENPEDAEARHSGNLITQPLHTISDQRTCKELRFHVFRGSVFHTQQKRRMTSGRVEGTDVPDVRTRNAIRTYSNGWVFANQISEGISPTLLQQAEVLALQCTGMVGIDLGCIDISLNVKSGSMMVIETGTSPALGGETTMTRYLDVLEEWVRESN